MHLGLSTYTFPWHIQLSGSIPSRGFSFIEMLDLTFEHHIHYFQFGDNYPLHLLMDNELEEIRETALKKNIQLQAGTRGLHVDNIGRYLEIAKKIGSPFLRVVIDDDHYHPSEAYVISVIRQLLPLLKDYNIMLSIENHDRFSAQALVRIIEETDPEYLAICLDTANSLGAGEGMNEILPLLLPYTINLHIKDFTISRVDNKMGFLISGAAAGDGILNIPRLLEACSKYPRCATATLELWMNREDTEEQTLAKEKAWINKSITFLNNYIQ
ncbi:MAG TPA: TIM barrel protein [Agriterribacter sp.]|nr:TIM barrel protein [Agriterribacter sp.]HRQ50242.1 TIM barrel protein [Agriterribacter sp.]